jgi:DNA repair exonuclease SbcCD ATPase subunit
MYGKKLFITVVWVCVVAFMLVQCRNVPTPTGTAYASGEEVGQLKQQNEQLKQQVGQLTAELDKLRQATQSSIDSVDSAKRQLDSGLEGARELEDSINALAEFAKLCLAEVERLREYVTEDVS